MKLNSKLQREIVYEKVVEYINSGKITYGERLTEGQLAKEFNVSRTPVREALLQLEKKGLLVIRLNAGATVKKVSVQQIVETYAIVSVLEGYAVETAAAEKLKESDVSYLNKLQQKMEQFASQRDYFHFAEINSEFHAFFVKKVNSITLSEAVADMRSRILGAIRLAVASSKHIDHYLLRHRMILDAISKGKSRRAGLLMSKHVREIGSYLSELPMLQNE
jgi:DNA-binding GntR family transcriptional regulator